MELPRFTQHDKIRNNILHCFKESVKDNKYKFNGKNLKENPIFGFFNKSTLRILGKFEVQWMPEHILEQFMVKGARLQDYEAVLIRALPNKRSDMHVHEHGCSLITCLAETYGFPTPTTELLFGHYTPQRKKQVVRRIPLKDNEFSFITPYVVHAFHTPPRGTAFALALACPPVKESEDKFDFVRLKKSEWEEKG